MGHLLGLWWGFLPRAPTRLRAGHGARPSESPERGASGDVLIPATWCLRPTCRVLPGLSVPWFSAWRAGIVERALGRPLGWVTLGPSLCLLGPGLPSQSRAGSRSGRSIPGPDKWGSSVLSPTCRVELKREGLLLRQRPGAGRRGWASSSGRWGKSFVGRERWVSVGIFSQPLKPPGSVFSGGSWVGSSPTHPGG